MSNIKIRQMLTIQHFLIIYVFLCIWRTSHSGIKYYGIHYTAYCTLQTFIHKCLNTDELVVVNDSNSNISIPNDYCLTYIEGYVFPIDKNLFWLGDSVFLGVIVNTLELFYFFVFGDMQSHVDVNTIWKKIHLC